MFGLMFTQGGGDDHRECLRSLDDALRGAEIATRTTEQFLADLAHGVTPSAVEISEKRAACRTYLANTAHLRAQIRQSLGEP